MRTSEYLYDCAIEELPSMVEGLIGRIERASKLLDKLLEVHLIDRDFQRISAVLRSIEHNNKLLHGMV